MAPSKPSSRTSTFSGNTSLLPISKPPSSLFPNPLAPPNILNGLSPLPPNSAAVPNQSSLFPRPKLSLPRALVRPTSPPPPSSAASPKTLPPRPSTSAASPLPPVARLLHPTAQAMVSVLTSMRLRRRMVSLATASALCARASLPRQAPATINTPTGAEHIARRLMSARRSGCSLERVFY